MNTGQVTFLQNAKYKKPLDFGSPAKLICNKCTFSVSMIIYSFSQH